MISSELRSAIHGFPHVPYSIEEETGDHVVVWHYLDQLTITPEMCTWCSYASVSYSLWCIDDKKWSLSYESITLATHRSFDMSACQHEWSTTPARDVLHIWEDWAACELASGDMTEEHFHAPRKVIEAKEAWCRGEIDSVVLGSLRGVVWDAINVAACDAACDAARSAARSAARPAARDAAGAAAWAASSDAARSAAWDAAWDAAYRAYSDQFTAHVLDCLRNGKHTLNTRHT